MVVVAVMAAAAIGSSQGAVAQSPTIDLSGEWRYLPMYDAPGHRLADPALDDSDWPTMRLPSNWFLLGKKEYPVAADLTPPFTGLVGAWGEQGRSALERGLDYSGWMWFRRTFEYPAGGAASAPNAGAHAILRFEMVDYFADVYVNGHWVGNHEGYFQPFEFDVSQWVKPGTNTLAVRVGAPAQIFDWNEDFPSSWPKRQAYIKGIFGYHDTRPGGTTSRGQERGTGGIVGDVTLRRSTGVDVVRAHVTPRDVSAERATLEIEYVVRNWSTAARAGTLVGEIAPKNFTSSDRDQFTHKFEAPPGESRVRITRSIARPALWWSWDYGKPNLYRLTTQLSGGMAGGHETAFGIRSITKDANWVWRLNGQRIFPRGSNYISTQWLSQADRAWYERDIKLMLGANLNSIRVHAHVEKPEFYEVADELGLMIWQDFPLQWGYTDLPGFKEEAIRQLGDMASLLFNHPSIVIWSMHNEAPHAMTWMKRKVQDQNLALDTALVSEIARLDPSRPHHRDSGTGDGHPYKGWYEGKVTDFVELPGAPFVNEYGAQAIPNLETVKTMFPADVIWPDNDKDWETWAFHNFQREQTFNIAKVPMGRSIEEFIANTQNYQAAVIRFATEHYRRAKWTKATGVYQFMFVEDWPSITWAVVDYYRRPKRGYTALRDSMQPVLPSIEYAIDDPRKPLTLWIVNDRLAHYPAAILRWRIGGQEQKQSVDIGPDSVQKVVSVGPATDIASGKTTLEVWIDDGRGNVLGRNTLEKADFVGWKQ